MSSTKNNNSNIEDLYDLIRGKTTLAKIVNKSDWKPKKSRKAKEKKFNTSKKKIEPIIQYINQDDKKKEAETQKLKLANPLKPYPLPPPSLSNSAKLKNSRGKILGDIDFEKLDKKTPFIDKKTSLLNSKKSKKSKKSEENKDSPIRQSEFHSMAPQKYPGGFTHYGIYDTPKKKNFDSD